MWIHPDNKISDLDFAFTPGIINAFSLSTLRLDLCPPEGVENQLQTSFTKSQSFVTC